MGPDSGLAMACSTRKEARRARAHRCNSASDDGEADTVKCALRLLEACAAWRRHHVKMREMHRVVHCEADDHHDEDGTEGVELVAAEEYGG